VAQGQLIKDLMAAQTQAADKVQQQLVAAVAVELVDLAETELSVQQARAAALDYHLIFQEL
jgi:hypothetical protein